MRVRLVKPSLCLGILWFGWANLSNAFAAQEPSSGQPEPSQATPNPPEGAPVPAPTTEPIPIPVPVPAPAPAPAAPPETTVIIVTPPAQPSLPPPPSFRIEGSNGSTLRVGLLLQPQFQSVNDAKLDKYSNNLYLRRTRILLGGTLFGVFDYFLDTDYPNLFLPPSGTAAGGSTAYLKNTPGMNIQDAFGTWRIFHDMVKVDFGYMLPPLIHNAVQGATTLYSWDYFNYAFQQGNQFGSSGNPIGRDLGIQARGLLVDGHLEYRAGLFQGRRDAPTTTEVGSRNFFRFAARVQLNLLDAEPGFFYQGTYLGTRKILSVGGAVDLQDSYRMYGGDVFLDLPIGPLGVVTAQGNLAHWNGHDFITTLFKQTAVMAEAGFVFSMLALGPILRFEHLWLDGPSNDQTRYVAGAAFWPFGHNSNVKAFYTRFHEQGGARDLNQVNVQWQLYFF